LINLCLGADLVVASKAYIPNLKLVKDALKHFSAATGLQANQEKSQIFML